MAGPLLPRALRAAGPSRLLARGAAGRAGRADPALQEVERYLRQAFPEEWPVARLAQGFGVSPDVIQRVLRSKFSPPLERRMKQDAKVLG
ncbi:unnamed protein product [Caretta caretta]